MYPLVTAYTQWSGIHKTDTGTRSQQYRLDKDGHRKKDFPFQLYKTVIRHPFGKQMCQMLADIFQIEMFEASVAAGMKRIMMRMISASLIRLGLFRCFPFFVEVENM
jgi:hypothetical protein